MRLCAFLAVLLALVTSAALAQNPPAFVTTGTAGHPLVGKIWRPASGTFVTVDDLVRDVVTADAVLLGETHDNPDHHALQAWLLGRILASGKRPLVAFEMVDSSQKEALDRFLAANPLDAAGLGPALAWESSGWPDWDNYRPIAEAALRHSTPLAPANLSRDQMRRIARGDIPEELASLALDTPVPDDIRHAMEQEIKGSHCGMLPDSAVPSMVRVQRARDAVMAQALADGLARQGAAVLIAGAGHVRVDRGVPERLADRAAGKRILAVAFVEVEDGETDPAGYGGLYDSPTLPFDAVWFTPRAAREDQCEALRKHLDKKKTG